jgi:hypothetical protein
MAITATEMATAILQFQSGSAVKDTDQIPYISAGTGNTAQKVTADIFRQYLTAKITPTVGADGYWYIGGTKLTTTAKGETPHLAKDDTGVYYYLDSETVNSVISKHYLVYLTEFKVSLGDMTTEQYNALATAVTNQISSNIDSTVTEKVNTAVTNAIGSTKTDMEAATKKATDAANSITNMSSTYKDGLLTLKIGE